MRNLLDIWPCTIPQDLYGIPGEESKVRAQNRMYFLLPPSILLDEFCRVRNLKYLF